MYHRHLYLPNENEEFYYKIRVSCTIVVQITLNITCIVVYLLSYNLELIYEHVVIHVSQQIKTHHRS